MQVCEAPGCTAEVTRVISGRAFCGVHRAGDLVAEAPLALCAIDGCGSPAAVRGLCRYHAGHLPPQRAA